MNSARKAFLAVQLEDLALRFFLVAVGLGALAFFASTHWETFVAPAIQAVGAWAWLLRQPLYLLLAFVLAFIFLWSGRTR